MAGLARNYVSVLERGEYRPTWKTMAQIADALKLSPVERAGLFQRADLADKPAEVRESTAVPIPVASGITLWKHFPGLLFQVPHFCAPSCMVYPDVIFPELIRATGALLSWIALKINPPTGKTLACLRDRASDCVQNTRKAQGDGVKDWYTRWAVALAVPHMWRTVIFGTAKSTEKMVQELSRWDFFPAEWAQKPNEIFVQLADPALNRIWGVQAVDPNAVADLHDALTVHDLWDKLGLLDSLGPPTENPYLARCSLGKDLLELMKFDPALPEKRYHVGTTGPQPGMDFLFRCCDMLANAHFAIRILDTPELARRLVDEEFNYGADEVQAKIITVASVLGIEPYPFSPPSARSDSTRVARRIEREHKGEGRR